MILNIIKQNEQELKQILYNCISKMSTTESTQIIETSTSGPLCIGFLKNGNPCPYKKKYGFYCGIHSKTTTSTKEIKEEVKDGYPYEYSDGNKYLFFYSRKDPMLSFLSNFYLTTFKDDRGLIFTSVEQYMHFEKAVLFKDKDIAKKILNSTTPLDAKRLGRKVQNFDDKIWSINKQQIVKKGLLYKFQQEDLKEKLLKTEDSIIVEAAPRDRIWGIGMSQTNALKNKDKWGQNLLGKLLMQVRSELE